MFNRTEYRRNYYWKHRDRINKFRKEKYLKNRALILERRRYRTPEQKERIRAEQKEYRNRNRERLKEQRRLKRLEKSPEQKREEGKGFYALSRMKTPWVFHLYAARNRCSNPNHVGYKRYGARGIKCILTVEDVRFLWLRDKAELMKKPSLDRNLITDHYTRETCSFLELVDNIKKAHPKRIDIVSKSKRKKRPGLYEKLLKTWK